MVLDDAHWIDPTSRELLDLTLDRVSGLRVLVVVTYRPEFQHAWSGQPYVTTLALNRLGERDGAALVEQLARGRIDPMRVLKYHQNRPVSRQGFELMQQRFEQLLALALRAQIEVGGRVWQ